MDKKIITIIGIVIIIAVIVALFLNFNVSKEDTKIKMTSNSSLNEDSSIKIKLTDLNKTPIDNQTVNIKIINKNGKVDAYSVKTDKKGNAKLKINKIKPGTYTVNFTYDGNNIYNPCNLSKKVKIVEKVVTEAETEIHQSTQSSSSSEDDGLYYDGDINVYYNSEGIIVDPDGQHPMEVGNTYDNLVERKEKYDKGELSEF